MVQGGKGKTQVGKKGRGGTSLRDLVESGMLNAGRNKLTVIFKGITYTASLEADGIIAYQGAFRCLSSIVLTQQMRRCFCFPF